MANIVIVSTTNSIKVSFGAYYPTALEGTNGVWRKENISFEERANYIVANIEGEKEWHVSDDGNSTDVPTFQIDTIDTVAPTSLADLFTKLEVLLA